MPMPFNPLTGEHATLAQKGFFSYCAMMQVIEEDTHDNYLVCRGYDPESGRFLASVNVAKPYGERGDNDHVVGEVFPAMKPMTALGTTSGVSAESTGHPADLDEAIEILYDDDDKPVWWLMITGGSGSSLHWCTLDDDLVAGDSTGVSVTLDVGGTQAGVHPSRSMPTNTQWSSGTVVAIAKFADSKWYAIHGPCPEAIPE
jgi:hypothetical protein